MRDAVAALVVQSFVDEQEVVIEMHGDDMSVVVRWHITRLNELRVIESVRQAFKKRHHRLRRIPLVAAPAHVGPIGSLGILDDIDSIRGQQRKQDLKSLEDVFRSGDCRHR